jgi:chromosomal replication initiation ATPase DnaA
MPGPGKHIVLRAVNEVMAELVLHGLAIEFDTIARRHGVLLQEALSGQKTLAFVATRQEFWYVLRQRGWSLKRIAVFFGYHHPTILLGIRQHVRRASDADAGREAIAS